MQATAVKERKMSKKEILEKSIVLNGPMGSGKTTISIELGREMKMPVIHLDTMRFLLSEKDYDMLLKMETDPFEIKRLTFLRDVRKTFPKIKTFNDFGFNSIVCKEFRDYFGVLGRHLYTKQFDNMLLEEVLKRIDQPCIIDMGGTMGISLDWKYRTLFSVVRNENPKLVDNYINFEYMGFEKIQEFLAHFGHVVELRLPENYKTVNKKAEKSELNEIFITSGQYNTCATMVINIDDLVRSNEGKDDINMNRLIDIVDEIIANVREKEGETSLFYEENEPANE